MYFNLKIEIVKYLLNVIILLCYAWSPELNILLINKYWL